MARKSEGKKKRSQVALTPEESMELQMILDRISVQVAEGESFQVYLASLRKLLEGRDRVVVELLSELARNPSPAGLKVFRTLADGVTDKGLRKMVRQAAYRFAQKGLAVEQGDTPQERVVLVQREQKKAVAHLILGPGTLWFLAGLIPVGTSGWPTLFISFFENGYHKLVVRLTEASNKSYRDLLATASGAVPGVRACEIPMWHAARLFSEMITFSEAPGSAFEVEELTKLLAPFRNPEKLPYIYELMDPVDNPLERLREIKVEALLGKMDIQWLFFPKDELEPFHRKLLDLEHSVLFVAEDIRRVQHEAVMRDAADSLCVGKRRLLFQRFFEEQALWWKTQGREDLADESFVVARHLGSDSTVSENRAVILLVGASLRHHWPQEEESEDEPGETAEPFYRTESGLFVPR
ncbi:MAG: hypothetical protein HGA84_07985 [Syntrophobacteraceae bacterium]|nr:hypothetical protein [Syntrophobacteraceae bacterium]